MEIESVLIEIEDRLKTIENKYGYLSYLIEKRLANEKLIQLEVMRIISLQNDVVEYLPERLYPNSSAKCDFWFRTSDGIENWMEIKTRPTNYRKPGHAKAITNGIDSIIGDINRLREKAPSNARKYVLFALYPIYSDSFRPLSRHLTKIGAAASKEVGEPAIEIACKNGHFQIYMLWL